MSNPLLASDISYHTPCCMYAINWLTTAMMDVYSFMVKDSEDEIAKSRDKVLKA